MRIHIRRVAVAALLCSTLALSAACSHGSGDGDGAASPSAGGEPGTGARPSETAQGTGPGSREERARDAGGGPGRTSNTPPLTRAELRRALLAQGSVPGYTVRPVPDDALPADATVVADRPECRPIADAFSSRPTYPRTAYTSASLVKGDLGKAGGTLSQLLLAAYRAGDAHRWVAELRRAVEVCRDFTATDGSGDREALAITPGDNLAVGDASVSFLMRDKAGKDAPVAITVVRTGGNTATFMSAGTSGGPEPVARAVAYEQHRRMMDAGKVPR
ncbi:hypothetical protein [Streptomyces sp. NPDC057702]|uniref:hypothetical protein n=1 Tax=unclassified Streptomyces TaxID=2593676 RepID=UPI0036B18F9B